MSDVAIRVEGLGKRYRLGGPRERYSTLRDQVGKWTSLRRLLRRADRAEHRPPFWALKGVSFDVMPGEVVGIIGRNGAGKSTLLKVLSRITEPTEGEADIHGRVVSLLEVGTGFHPELTGRENAYLNGAILGMRRAEIARKLDEIVAFAEVEKFIDTPVKYYSSGMYMRLAFAVAAHLEPEILIVDEVLAVGDAEFQKKCLGKMGDVARDGRTVLFVSHNISAVASLCTKGFILRAGGLVFDGPAREAVRQYIEQAAAGSRAGADPTRRPGTGEWRIIRAEMAKSVYDPAEPKEVVVTLEPQLGSRVAAFVSALLVDDQGSTLAQFDSRLTGFWLAPGGPITARLRVANLWLRPGTYTVNLYICAPGGVIDLAERACAFEVSSILPYLELAPPGSISSGLVLTDFQWSADRA